MKYLIQSREIRTPGSYEYRLISKSEARRWAAQGFDSAIYSKAITDWLEGMLCMPVKTARRWVELKPKDEAIVMLIVWPPSAHRDMANDIRVANMISQGHYELGLLTRTK